MSVRKLSQLSCDETPKFIGKHDRNGHKISIGCGSDFNSENIIEDLDQNNYIDQEKLNQLKFENTELYNQLLTKLDTIRDDSSAE